MNVVEKRVRGILRQAKPLAARMSKEQLDTVLRETFGEPFAEPDPPAPFHFQAANGLTLSIRPEWRGKRQYWFCNKQLNGISYRLYIGPAGKLTRELLENAAAHIDYNSVTLSAESVTGGGGRE